MSKLLILVNWTIYILKSGILITMYMCIITANAMITVLLVKTVGFKLASDWLVYVSEFNHFYYSVITFLQLINIHYYTSDVTRPLREVK